MVGLTSTELAPSEFVINNNKWPILVAEQAQQAKGTTSLFLVLDLVLVLVLCLVVGN